MAIAVSALFLCSQSHAQENNSAKAAPKKQVSPNQVKVDRKHEEFFERKIRPVLIKRCFECHSRTAGKKNGGLYLDSSADMKNGGDTGPALLPGDANNSLFLSALKYEDLEMPPDGKLDPQTIRDFEYWINNGAVDPRKSVVTKNPSKKIDWETAGEFWSFKPPTLQKLPQVGDKSWPRNRIDYFALAKLEANNLTPAKSASKRELRRRLSFDLTGLPPRNHQEEHSIDAYVDSLMATPEFGEKWARLWLDIARFAEDQAHIVGNNQSLFYPNAYLYRDWVIDALNDDLPFDEFVNRQLAVDLIAKEKDLPLDDRELVALGFIGLGPKYYRRNDPSVMADEWEDRVDTVSRGLMGLTVACARCHDHKYDPIETEDYYALAGVFASTEMHNKPLAQKADQQKQTDTKNEKKQNAKDKKKKKKKTPAQTIHIVRDKSPKNLNVHIRGNVDSKGAKVERRFLRILDPKLVKFNAKTSGRLELARAITNPSNPLVARVIVNRVWAELIGKPLVGTPSNFGALGDRPTHPRLLDDLAFRFVENGWSLKRLIREIVRSQVYRQSSVASATSLAKDPSNELITRMNRKSLSVEQWRDAILANCNALDHDIGGRSIDPSDPKQRRRTIYSRVSRFQLNSMLALFDFPDPNAHAAKRNRTISPLQKMFALNSSFLLKQTDKLDAELKRGFGDMDNNHFVRAAYEHLFQRKPSSDELRLANQFLNYSVGQSGPDDQLIAVDPNARKTFLQTLLISNEFIFVD